MATVSRICVQAVTHATASSTDTVLFALGAAALALNVRNVVK
jgi:hypothetical protein